MDGEGDAVIDVGMIGMGDVVYQNVLYSECEHMLHGRSGLCQHIDDLSMRGK